MGRKPPRRLPNPDSRHRGAAGEPDLPSLLELERFSGTSLHQWLLAKKALDGGVALRSCGDTVKANITFNVADLFK